MATSKEPPEGAQHYDSAEEVPWVISKYWHQRHNIFSKRIASDIAASAPANKTILVDAFAGAGGNTIAFALSGRWKQIFAFEKDATVLACAKHNAEVYGVAKKIFWVHGDAFAEIPRRLKQVGKSAVVFASPPWGGPTYSDYEVFDLTVMGPYTLPFLCSSFFAVTPDVVLYLPRTSDLRQLAKYAKPGQKLQVTHYCMHGASKALCVYFGSFAAS
ncbi:putative diacylglycerol O-acyltransferase tgs1 [Elasticomyces elasticus]|nr:putative diacylglycerol O-acyltransferase tgs1 [Elasticomyces elasticus]KAK3646731.1 putative diacylglycerol O-acyltransferase tgs1 [Elasticomyces elasticus]KAK5749040.1 putative diacylglycerol O-acyltransferase tgs1 [Elasticomyces elasticus]